MRTSSRLLAAAALTALAISLIPLLRLAPYDAPAADDFGYGAPVHYALQAGLGLPGVLGAIAENVRYTFFNWQGTYSSVLLFSIQPGAFAENLYVLTPFVMLAVIIAPVFLALGTLRGANRAGLLFIGSVIALISVQYLPSPADGIYWWNGAAHYLVFWCLGVLVVTQQLRLLRAETGGRAFYTLLAAGCIGAFFVAGGNYSTALVFVLLSGMLSVSALIRRRGRRVITANVLMTGLAVVGLAVSMAAPGNMVRQSGLTRLDALSAIGLSFLQAIGAVQRMTDLKILGGLLLCVPAFLASVRKSGYQFRWPLLVLLGSFCAFAALYTPPLYAMGASAVPRMENLFWLAYVFLVFGNGFYLAGWAARYFRRFDVRYVRWGLGAACLAGALVLGAALLIQCKASNAYLAHADLGGPVLERYQQERAERIALAEDKSILPPRFKPISACPVCFPESILLTWTPDLMIDGVPASLLCCHACGGEVTFVPLEQAKETFGIEEPLSPAGFSKRFAIGGEDCVPLREFCDRFGFRIDYDLPCDTIWIQTQ